MNSGASEILPMVAAILAQSSSPIWPLRSFCRCTRASADSRRMVISLRLISSEKTTDVMPCLIDADRAMSMPIVDLPMAGRAARTIIWPGCRPLVSRSRSEKPVGTPIMPSPRWPAASISSTVAADDVAEDQVVLRRCAAR